jgi:hypothetical protein
MIEEILLPEEQPQFIPDFDFEGLVTVRSITGGPLNPLAVSDFQPIVLTCIPSDAIFVETTTLESNGEFVLEDPESVLGNGFPVCINLFGG